MDFWHGLLIGILGTLVAVAISQIDKENRRNIIKEKDAKIQDS